MAGYAFKQSSVSPITTSGRYMISCHQCASQFDTAAVQFCGCISSERTLVCPICCACFCRSPLTYHHEVWKNAPTELWARRAAARGSDEATDNASPVDVSERPLVLVVDDQKLVRTTTSLIAQ